MGKDSKYGLISLSLILIIFFSMLLITSPVSATSATAPSSPITVQQGGVFLLRGTITFNQAATGYFIYGPVYWYNYGDPTENFRLENTPSIYWTDGTPVENVAINDYAVPDGWQVDIGDDGSGIARNGTFTIDIWLRAASGDGTLHAADNENIYFAMDQISWFEPGSGSVTAGPIIVQVLGRGVDVSISPESQENRPGQNLAYTVTVKNTGNLGNDNYNLTISDNAGWGANITLDNTRLENIPANENRTTTLHVHIPENAIGSTNDNITIKATSQGNENTKDNASCIAHVNIVRGVHVSISPTYQENLAGGKLTYIVTVVNTGNITDSYTLSTSDNENWGPTLSDNQFNSIQPFKDNETTLNITIPENAVPCTKDNIKITATSKDNENVSAENTCIAHAAVIRGVTVSISPSDNSGLPADNLTYEVMVTNTGNVSDNYNLTVDDSANPSWNPRLSENRMDNVQPEENRTIVLSIVVPSDVLGSTIDNIQVTATSMENLNVKNSENCRAQALIFRRVEVSISPSENSGPPGEALKYTVTVKNTGNVPDNYTLDNMDNAGWVKSLSEILVGPLSPNASENVTLNVTIPADAENGDEDIITVRATSQADAGVFDNNACVAHTLIIRGVEVSISPSFNENIPNGTLSYTVTIKNIGNIEDNYTLTVNDNENWGPTLDNAWLLVPRNDNRTTMLRVTVPENAVPYTRDNITVTATSQATNTIQASASCIAQAALPVGVEVSITPNYNEGPLGTALNYIVTVKNLGGLEDNYDLTVSDILGWPLGLSDNLLTNIPPNENENVTLTVTIPENAVPGNEDNITVNATSQADNTIDASASCIAHVLVIKTEIRTLIYPTADIDAFDGYSRSQLKFDISGIPPGSGIISAKLWMYRLAADNWDGNVTLYRVENQSWGESITASEFDNQTLTDGENNAGKFMSHGWDNLDVLTQLGVDYDAVHTFSSFRLGWIGDKRSEPSVGVEDTRYLLISGEAEGISIVFCSSEYGGRDPYLDVVYVPPYSVSVSISPNYISRLPGENATFLVTVINTGNLDDNYSLKVSDNAGWGLSLLPSVMSVASGSSGEATLTVAIPENATGGNQDNITVIATSQTDNTVSDNDSCVAHVTVVRRVELSIEPRSQFGLIGENVVFTITVKNMGDIWENYQLENIDDAGWTLKLDNGYLEIPKNENRETKLTITVPDNENLVFTTDNITVVATTLDNAEVTDNDTVTVQAALPWMGTATFKLENLYKVSLNKDLQLYTGSNLVVKFYRYDNTLQAESVIHNFTPPENISENVKENENVPQPRGAERYPWGTVQIARLVLTTDNTENEIATIASFTVHQSDLRKRYIAILRAWGDHPEQQSAFRAEVIDILKQWGDASP